MKTALTAVLTLACLTLSLHAQSAGVPIVHEGHGTPPELLAAAKKLRTSGKLLAMDKIKDQLAASSSCQVKLPPANSQPLAGSEICNRARKAHIRVGYLHLCNKCDKWHLSLAGGYAIAPDGIVATCYHVAEPENMKEGYLVATTSDGAVLPVTKILAANKLTDSCILQVKSETPLDALPLNANVSPGDVAWCYSDPSGRPGYFSTGIINRFYQHWDGADSQGKHPVRLDVSTDWSPGSSGSAVLDSFGNAIGHVSRISTQGSDRSGKTNSPSAHASETWIVFHEAVRAADVLALVKPGR